MFKLNELITVVDLIKPSLSCTDITIQLGADGTYTLDPMDAYVSADDNCTVFDPFFPKVQGVPQDLDFDCADIGSTFQRRIRVKDQSNNKRNCNFNVTVQDAEAPIALCQDLTIQLDETGNQSIRIDNEEYKIPKSKESSNSQSNILGVRPEKMFLSDNKGIPGEVYGSEYLGTRKILTIQSLFGKYKVRVSNDVNLKRGSSVKINFESESAIIFDNETDKALQSEFIN